MVKLDIGEAEGGSTYMCDITKDELSEYYGFSDYSKSNILISSKYKSTLLENKIMAISLSRIQEAYEDPAGGLTVTLKAAELKKLLNTKSGNIYDQLDKTAARMTGRSIGMSNPEKEEFHYMAVVTNAYYKDGNFSIEYNKTLNKYLRELKQNFTILNLETMLSFTSGYAFRIYELVKSRMYTPKGVINKENKFKISFGLAEFKFEIGIINAELSSVKVLLNNSKTPDYEKAASISEEKMFNSWPELRRKVIEVAIKEINEKTELEIDYDTQTAGRGGKVIGIDFYAKKKEKIEDVLENTQLLTSEEKDDIIDQILEYIEEDIRIRDARAIAEAANYNLENIKDKYELSKSFTIVNITGWMIKAISDNYDKKIVGAEKKNKINQNNAFNNFDQREYKFDEKGNLIL